MQLLFELLAAVQSAITLSLGILKSMQSLLPSLLGLAGALVNFREFIESYAIQRDKVQYERNRSLVYAFLWGKKICMHFLPTFLDSKTLAISLSFTSQ